MDANPDDHVATIRAQVAQLEARIREVDQWLAERADGANLSRPAQEMIIAEIRAFDRTLERLRVKLAEIERAESRRGR
jgi:prefoldin subunit 5